MIKIWRVDFDEMENILTIWHDGKSVEHSEELIEDFVFDFGEDEEIVGMEVMNVEENAVKIIKMLGKGILTRNSENREKIEKLLQPHAEELIKNFLGD